MNRESTSTASFLPLLSLPSGPENSQAFLTLRSAGPLGRKINRPRLRPCTRSPRSYPAKPSPDSRNLGRNWPMDAIAPLESAHSKHCCAVCGIAEQASKKERRGRSASSNKKGVSQLPPSSPSPDDENWNCWVRRRWSGQIIWMLFSSHCYTKCGGGGGRVSWSVRRHPKSGRDEFPINQTVRSPKRVSSSLSFSRSRYHA